MVRLCSLIGCAVILAAFITGTGRSGDTKKDPPKAKQPQLPQGWLKLGLSADQKKKVYATRADFTAKIESLKAQIDDLKKQERKELLKILTEEQRDQLRKILAEKAGDVEKKTTKDKDKKSSSDK